MFQKPAPSVGLIDTYHEFKREKYDDMLAKTRLKLADICLAVPTPAPSILRRTTFRLSAAARALLTSR